MKTKQILLALIFALPISPYLTSITSPVLMADTVWSLVESPLSSPKALSIEPLRLSGVSPLLLRTISAKCLFLLSTESIIDFLKLSSLRISSRYFSDHFYIPGIACYNNFFLQFSKYWLICSCEFYTFFCFLRVIFN